jgi:hypothetical protein
LIVPLFKHEFLLITFRVNEHLFLCHQSFLNQTTIDLALSLPLNFQDLVDKFDFNILKLVNSSNLLYAEAIFIILRLSLSLNAVLISIPLIMKPFLLRFPHSSLTNQKA